MSAQTDLETVEIDLLLEGIYRQRGFDFRNYARQSLKRRLLNRARAEDVGTISALQDKILHDPGSFDRLLLDLLVNVTAMFRDPGFYSSLRAHALPLLRTYPFLRVWNAGCSTGEETYSLAILLEEAGLLARARLYATDMNETALDRARSGAFPLAKMRQYTENYIKAEGTRAFSDYYTVEGDVARFSPSLVDNVVFAQHDLVSDASFNEFHLIVCRNVLIYFDRELQDRVHTLFCTSLATFGILGLGQRETVRFTAHAGCYTDLDRSWQLFRRIT